MASHEDQLVAAVNDKMDPITLLVWCEESLGPKELPTLNKLLRADDGTLAQEIGWNLLEMILPMLQDDFSEASKCLDCISRRGNPREVIVKVAEVLERLGEDMGFSEDELGSEDELPTFAGEADRIHLGTLTLDGTPAGSAPQPSEASEVKQKSMDGHPTGQGISLATLQFQSLMSILALVHVRIKTQYPSRFLATSLPAALGAFRRIGITATSTLAFLSFLGKLSGRRPPVPPRASLTAAKVAASEQSTISTRSTESAPVSLPDSEPELEGSSMQQASEDEKAIVLKLLQAVLLEGLDDYMASLQSRDPSHMSWTTRLREKSEPHRLVPGKSTELQKWQESTPLSERDRVIEELLTVSKDLKLDVSEYLRNLLDGNGHLRIPTPLEEDNPESPSDYPTKPSQVPFPPSGMLFLHAAQQFSSQSVAGLESGTDNTLVLISRVYHFFRSPQNTSYLHASFATEDALLSLLYLLKDKPQPMTAEFDFKTFFMSLATFCAEFPDPQLRDAAHHIATALFHNCPDVNTKLNLVIEILKHSTSSANLKAAAISWIKDELLWPTQSKTGNRSATKIKIADLESDPNVLPLLFPEYREESGQYNFAELPYYIDSLNLIFVSASDQTPPRSKSAMQSTVGRLQEWRAAHRTLENGLSLDETSQEVKDALEECRTELWALDDALGRASEALKSHPVDVK